MTIRIHDDLRDVNFRGKVCEFIQIKVFLFLGPSTSKLFKWMNKGSEYLQFVQVDVYF